MMATATALAAFDPPVDTAGPLTARIEGPARITAADAPLGIVVRIENVGSAKVSGTVRLAVIDGWIAEPASVPFTATAQGKAHAGFRVMPAAGSFNAHYPVHAFIDFTASGTALVAHPVLLVEVKRPDPPRAAPAIPWAPVDVPPDAALALWRLPVHRTILRVFGESARTLPVGWSGEDTATRAWAGFSDGVDRGGWRDAVVMHPPWVDRAGTILTEYPVRLPPGRVRLTFATAIRDNAAAAAEPPSDGVTFRVRVAPLDAPEGTEGEVVFEHHTLAKRWEAHEADLAKFAGQAVRIQLESHPGPKNDTTCDQSYWAEPTVVAGKPPASPKPAAAIRSLGTIADGKTSWTVRVRPGSRGLLDAAVEMKSGDRTTTFRGFRVRVLGDTLDDPRSAIVLRAATEEPAPNGWRVRHRFESWAGAFDVVGELAVAGPALHASFRIENAPPPRPWTVVRLDEVAAGPWTSPVRRIFAGDGNVIDRPGAFDLGFDGHRLSTSFVGFEFADGTALVQGVDAVPDALRVDPAARRASLSSPGDQRLTFIPCRSVWDGARAWHDVNGLAAAGGVGKLAGRFVFDLWGGRYAESAQALGRAFRYGLTDAAVVWHVWQRHGYDYRLPDIWPPREEYGTLAEFAALANACRERGVLFAPHDNYIDFYPDYDGFSYDQIAFDSAGSPVRAWLNSWHANAQSYRSRPDADREPLERNVKLIKAGIAPDAYFIDVWSSIGPYDCWTRDGRFLDRSFTRTVWGEAFAWIRQELGGNAPQISESGHDALIGFLDGAQTNHLRVGPPLPGDMSWCTWDIQCADAERVPWSDAAHHDRFVLHGAGYPGRYEGGLDEKTHGIWSDDYIATEMLDGHPAMVSRPFGRDVVRKYWLTHDVARALALARMVGIEFVGGDLHREQVRWEGGGEVFVNRGKTAWQLKGHVLPPFGFYARIPSPGGRVEAGIERKGSIVTEWSHGPSGVYLNPRGGKATVNGVTAAGACRISVADGAVTVTPLPESKAFTVSLKWKDLPWKLPDPSTVDALSEDGSVLRSAPVKLQNGSVILACDPRVFSYRLR